MTAERRITARLAACLLIFVPLTTFALEMPFLERNITNQDIVLRLDDVQSKTQLEIFARLNVSFTGKKRHEKLTLDERCARGLPLSVRWTNYGPYGSLVRGLSSSVEADGVGLTGIFPSVINNVLRHCCHKDTRVVYGHYIKTLIDLEQSLSREDEPDDIMFPLGLQSMSMKMFKKLPVVPLLVSPRTTLVVPDVEKQGKTLQLFRTVGNAWRILLFIFLAAIVSGIFIWALDHITNPDEFPTKFSEGVWEGFWWAVVTMTTVGYGDRAPRSFLGRMFCIIWIVTGMSIVAIFTAMVTASLSASIQYRFVIHGSVMGCVDGSREERIGTGMNADIRTFGTPKDVIAQLVDTTNLEAVLMDSYLLTRYHEVIKREPVRVKQNYEQPINYGLAMAPNSTNFTECFTRYVHNYPQEIFNSVRNNYKPLKNPTDDISEELKASQGFLKEEAFHIILYALAGFLAAFFLLGLIWEFCISKFLCRRKQEQQAKTKKSIVASLLGTKKPDDDRELERSEMNHLELIKHKSAKIRQLIREFDDFYEKWMEKLKETAGSEDWGKFGKLTDKNESFLMVTYNGNQP